MACVPCNDIGCAGGFEWTGSRTDEAPLTPGAYVFTVGLEDDVFEVTCTVGPSYETSDCELPVHVTGDIEWNLEISLSMAANDGGDSDGGDGDGDGDGTWDPTAPVVGFYLRASDTSGSDADGSYSETRGPTEVDIAVTLDDAELFGVEYDVEYVRDDDYRGDPSCGFCDESQSRSFSW
jgi:hypothetical protein